MIDFVSIVDISMGLRSKTFWEINDCISFSKAKVHFSGVGDFWIDCIDLGIYNGNWHGEQANEGR